MKKLRLFLSIIIFFLTGYSQLYAHTPNAEECYSQTKVFKGSELDVHYTAVSGIKKTFKIEVADIGEEEEEIVSSKKQFASDFFMALFFALAIGYFFFHVRKCLALYKHFSYYTSYRRYISFRVIII